MKCLPGISMFYGIIVSLYFQDNRRHHRPHIHVKYQDEETVVAIPEGQLLDSHLPPSRLQLVFEWVEIDKDALMADWELAVYRSRSKLTRSALRDEAEENVSDVVAGGISIHGGG